MDQYSSDGTQSVDSGIIVSDFLSYSTESQRTRSQQDLTRMFRLEDRSIVCAFYLVIYYLKLLTAVSDRWTGWARHGPGTDASAIRRGRDSY